MPFTKSKTRCWDANCNGLTSPTKRFSTQKAPRIVKTVGGGVAVVSRIVRCNDCGVECPALNRNSLLQLPPPLAQAEFKGLIDPATFNDDGTTILSAAMSEIAATYVARGDPLSASSDYFNAALIRRKVGRMQRWWYDNACYRACLEDVAGDEAWSSMALEQQVVAAADRAEFLNMGDVEDITDRVFADSVLGDAEAIDLALSLGVDANRVSHRQFADSAPETGFISGVGTDWAKLTSKHLGDGELEKWLFTVTDQHGRLLAAWFVYDTKLETTRPLLEQLRKNGVNPLVITVDNLPPSINRDTGLVQFLKGDAAPEGRWCRGHKSL